VREELLGDLQKDAASINTRLASVFEKSFLGTMAVGIVDKLA